MYLTISQYAKRCKVKYSTIAMRIARKTIACEIIEGKKMIDTSKFPPEGAKKAGRKKNKQDDKDH